LSSQPANLRYAREFSAWRRVRGQQTAMSRLYVAEPMPTPTGTKVDHRIALRASEMEVLAMALASALGVNAGGELPRRQDFDAWIAPMVRDLQHQRGRSLVMAGAHQPPRVQALAHAMNQALGNVGSTVFYTAPLVANPVDCLGSLWDLVH